MRRHEKDEINLRHVESLLKLPFLMYQDLIVLVLLATAPEPLPAIPAYIKEIGPPRVVV